jgi:PBP1b-binding outer membrane lipoprotein LpoB
MGSDVMKVIASEDTRSPEGPVDAPGFRDFGERDRLLQQPALAQICTGERRAPRAQWCVAPRPLDAIVLSAAGLRRAAGVSFSEKGGTMAVALSKNVSSLVLAAPLWVGCGMPVAPAASVDSQSDGAPLGVQLPERIPPPPNIEKVPLLLPGTDALESEDRALVLRCFHPSGAYPLVMVPVPSSDAPEADCSPTTRLCVVTQKYRTNHDLIVRGVDESDELVIPLRYEDVHTQRYSVDDELDIQAFTKSMHIATSNLRVLAAKEKLEGAGPTAGAKAVNTVTISAEVIQTETGEVIWAGKIVSTGDLNSRDLVSRAIEHLAGSSGN